MALAMLPGLVRLENDNSPRVFFVRGSEAVERYEDFRRQFGSDHVVRLCLSGEALWSAAGLDWFLDLEQRAAQVPGVADVLGPLTRRTSAGEPLPTATELRRRIGESFLDRHLGLLSDDGSTLTLIVRLASEDDAEQRRTTAVLRQLLLSAPDGIDSSVVGLPVLNQALDVSSREIEEIFFPALVAFAVVLLWCIFRDVSGLALPLGFVGFCLLIELGTMGYTGTRLNLVLAVLPPLLFVIALATALHLLLRFRQLHQTHDSRIASTLGTYGDKGWAVWWAGVTTFIGFASLAFSPVAPVRSLGRWAAFGLAIITVAAFSVYPVWMSAGQRRPATPRGLETWSRRWGRRWGRAATSHRHVTLGMTGILLVLAVAGLPRLEIESNALRYLSEDHPVRRDIEGLDRLGIGSATVEVLIDAGPSQPFDQATTMLALAQAGEKLIGNPWIFGAVSAGTVFEEALSQTPAFIAVDENVQRQLVWQGLREHPQGRQALDALLSDDGGTARLTLFVATVDHHQLATVLDAAREVLQQALPGANIAFTGQYPLLLEAQRHLLSTLAISLMVTLAAVSCILCWLLPGWRLPFLALLPNIWPVLGVLGFMGWAAVPLDIATVMVASVVLGLAVDDTLHTVGHFRHFAPRYGVREAVAKTLELTTSAYLLTGLILMVGFGVCALSQFAPTARFGGLSAFAIGLAVLGDLFLLPALLSLVPESTFRRQPLASPAKAQALPGEEASP